MSQKGHLYAVFWFILVGIHSVKSAWQPGMHFPNVMADPLRCYDCRNAASHEECNKEGMVKCSASQTSCQTEVRMMHVGRSLVPRITKSCKQVQACWNNFFQNDRPGWPSTQCNQAEYFPLYVCRYCCGESGCNSNTGELHCRKLEVPENGRMKCASVKGVSSSVCEFKCNECFKLEGSRKRTCKSNRRWSGRSTKCVYDNTCNHERCDIEMTTPIKNGDVTCSKGNSIGSVCEFLCDEGFHRFGNKKVKCVRNGRKWNSDKPRCEEGDTKTNPCHQFAGFRFHQNGTLSCNCRAGFEGDGFTDCKDIDECATEIDQCHEHASCTNTIGSYRCACKSGFTGFGFDCVDIDECITGDHECHRNGICINEVGSYSCICKPGFTGDGRKCSRIRAQCPKGQLKDGLICVRKNVTTTTTSIPATIFTTITIPPTEPELVSTPPVTVTMPTAPEPEIDWCVSFERGVPAVMKTASVYNRINKVLKSRGIPPGDTIAAVLGPWTGLGDRFQKGVLRWSDGCEFKKGDFNKWAPGEPKMRDDPDFQNCVHLVSDPISYGTRDFLWKVIKCSDSLRSTCGTEKIIKNEKLKICEPRIGDIINGKTSCSDGWNVDSICTFRCNKGYAIKEQYTRIICMERSLSWSNLPPTCVREACYPPLSPPSEGNVTCSNGNSVGTKCEFDCNIGFSIDGEKTVTCQRQGQWSASRPCCRDECPPFARMNLIFILDSSSSVGAKNFEDIKNFVLKLQKRFTISPDFTQVSAIVYHSKITTVEGNRIFDSNEEFEEAIKSLVYEGVGTYTGKAIEYVNKNIITKREGAKDVAVLLTDGKSQDDVKEPAQKLRQMNVNVIAVGVRGARWTELEMIASNPVAENVVGVDSFTDLVKTVENIRSKVCKSLC